MKHYLYWTLGAIFKRLKSRYKCLEWQRPTLCYVYICMAMFIIYWASPVAQIVKNLPAMQGTWVWSLVGEDPLEKGMAPHSSIFAWRIPWTEEPGGLQSIGSQTVGHDDWLTLTYWASYLYILIRESQLGWHLSILLMIMWK